MSIQTEIEPTETSLDQYLRSVVNEKEIKPPSSVEKSQLTNSFGSLESSSDLNGSTNSDTKAGNYVPEDDDFEDEFKLTQTKVFATKKNPQTKDQNTSSTGESGHFLLDDLLATDLQASPELKNKTITKTISNVPSNPSAVAKPPQNPLKKDEEKPKPTVAIKKEVIPQKPHHEEKVLFQKVFAKPSHPPPSQQQQPTSTIVTAKQVANEIKSKEMINRAENKEIASKKKEKEEILTVQSIHTIAALNDSINSSNSQSIESPILNNSKNEEDHEDLLQDDHFLTKINEKNKQLLVNLQKYDDKKSSTESVKNSLSSLNSSLDFSQNLDQNMNSPQIPITNPKENATKFENAGNNFDKVTIKQQLDQLDRLKKENFNLQLNIFHLMERLNRTTPESMQDLVQREIALKIQVEEVKKNQEFLTKQNTDLKENLKNLQNSYDEVVQNQKEEIAILKANQKGEIANLKVNQNEEIANLKANQKEEIANLKANQKEEIANLKVNQKGEVANQKEETPVLKTNQNLNENNRNFELVNAENAKLKADNEKLMKKYEILKQKAEKTIKNLKKKNEILKNSNSHNEDPSNISDKKEIAVNTDEITKNEPEKRKPKKNEPEISEKQQKHSKTTKETLIFQELLSATTKMIENLTSNVSSEEGSNSKEKDVYKEVFQRLMNSNQELIQELVTKKEYVVKIREKYKKLKKQSHEMKKYCLNLRDENKSLRNEQEEKEYDVDIEETANEKVRKQIEAINQEFGFATQRILDETIAASKKIEKLSKKNLETSKSLKNEKQVENGQNEEKEKKISKEKGKEREKQK